MGRDYPNDSIAKNGLESWDESWRLEETCCHSDSSENPSGNTDVKNCKGVNNNNNNNNNNDNNNNNNNKKKKKKKKKKKN